LHAFEQELVHWLFHERRFAWRFFRYHWLYTNSMNPNNQNIRRNISARIKSVSELLQKAVKAGVTIVAGADDYTVLGFTYGEMFKRTLFMYHTAGIGIPQVLQTATINAARHLRWENRLGTIKKGCWADLVAVDPAIEKDLNVLLNVRFKMKGGVVVKQ
jgi:imidazolonepropionase-like amidohydrolase